MNPEQRKVYEESVARGLPTGGPYTAYIRIPQFMALNREMSNYLRSNSLPGRLRQMIVLHTIKPGSPPKLSIDATRPRAWPCGMLPDHVRST